MIKLIKIKDEGSYYFFFPDNLYQKGSESNFGQYMYCSKETFQYYSKTDTRKNNLPRNFAELVEEDIRFSNTLLVKQAISLSLDLKVTFFNNIDNHERMLESINDKPEEGVLLFDGQTDDDGVESITKNLFTFDSRKHFSFLRENEIQRGGCSLKSLLEETLNQIQVDLGQEFRDGICNGYANGDAICYNTRYDMGFYQDEIASSQSSDAFFKSITSYLEKENSNDSLKKLNKLLTTQRLLKHVKERDKINYAWIPLEGEISGENINIKTELQHILKNLSRVFFLLWSNSLKFNMLMNNSYLP